MEHLPLQMQLMQRMALVSAPTMAISLPLLHQSVAVLEASNMCG